MTSFSSRLSLRSNPKSFFSCLKSKRSLKFSYKYIFHFRLEGTTLKSNLARKALILFTLVNLLNYIDRFIFSALLPAIQKDLGFSDMQLGALGSAFIFAYIFLSP